MKAKMAEIIEMLKFAKEYNIGCTLLAGAGCSKTAGIPLADEIVKHIEEKYEHAINKLSEEDRTYRNCMNELTLFQRRMLISDYIDSAKMNWASLGIAQLIKYGYIDRVLTTNFDPLISRACALSNEFPATHDLAVSKEINPYLIRDKAIFHLNGLYSGFIQIHTQEQSQKHKGVLKQVFESIATTRVWIVVGYSGANDMVLEQLLNLPPFENKLYWICYKDDLPPVEAMRNLIGTAKQACYIQNQDADSFFIKIAQELGLFPPDFVTRPFSYLKEILNTIPPYSMPGQESSINILTSTFEEVDSAIRQFEKNTLTEKTAEMPILHEHERFKMIQQAFMSGDYNKAISLKPDNPDEITTEIADMLSWAFIYKGNINFEQALTENEEKADELFKKAYENYDSALETKQDKYEALVNWGFALSMHAKSKYCDDAYLLLGKACEKYEAALKIKTDLHEALNNWGIVLSDQAKIKTGNVADELFKKAYEKYEAALKIKPDKHNVLFNWGTTLSDQAETKSDNIADDLFNQAYEKYEAAFKIKPDYYEAVYNWGHVLSEQAKTKTGSERDALYTKAYEKYEIALKTNPDFIEALNSWGLALSYQAKTKSGDVADELYSKAYEKYESVLKTKPDYYKALNNWGIALSEQANTKTGAVADELFDKAFKKYEAALKIKPDFHEALNNWGSSLRNQAKHKIGDVSDELFNQAYEKYEAALKIKPDKYEALSNWGFTLYEQATVKSGDEADDLFRKAYEKYEAILKIKPDKYELFYNWGNILTEHAKSKPSDEADELFRKAYEKYDATLKIKPDKHEALGNWVMALVEHSRKKEGSERSNLLIEAEKKGIEINKILQGKGSYNLACINALLGKSEECKKWLEESRDKGFLESKAHIEQDPDLDSVRNEQWFRDFMASLIK